MTAHDRTVRDDRRSLLVACLLLLVGAAGFWGAGSLTWFSVEVPTATRGTVLASVTGAQIQPTVTAVAAVLLAAVAAAVALSGIARRVLGVLVVLAGVAAGWASVASVLSKPTPAELVSARAGLNTGGQPVGTSAVSSSIGPWVAVAAAVVAVAAGLVLVMRERRMARLGARYERSAGGTSIDTAAPGADAPPPADPDRAAWQDLDDGRDPTADPHPGRRSGDL